MTAQRSVSYLMRTLCLLIRVMWFGMLYNNLLYFILQRIPTSHNQCQPTHRPRTKAQSNNNYILRYYLNNRKLKLITSVSNQICLHFYHCLHSLNLEHILNCDRSSLRKLLLMVAVLECKGSVMENGNLFNRSKFIRNLCNWDYWPKRKILSCGS